MMKENRKWPPVLAKKLALTFLAGAGCLVTGAVFAWHLRDPFMLVLSTLVMLGAALRGAGLALCIMRERYTVIEGRCAGIELKPFCKVYRVRITDDQNNETTLHIGKQNTLRIGDRYRFYFRKGELLRVGNAGLDAALSSGQFLGMERLELQEDGE